MKAYVWVSFAFMGWAYYEMSGGSDFVPQQQDVVVASAETEAEAKTAPEIVARAATPTILSVSASNVTPTPSVTAAVLEPALTPEPAAVEVVATPQSAVEEAEVIEASAPAAQPEPVDIRSVAGSRVNMRSGPGTNFDVLVTLDGGTALEVITVNANGWANVATLDRGIEGWMAERLLSDPDA